MVPLHVANDIHGDSYGLEIGPTWQVLNWWRLRAAYSYLETQMRGPDTTTINIDEGQSPRHQASLRSSMELPHNLSLDATLRYVDRLPTFPVSAYVALDVRLAWRPAPKWELSIVGQNLGSAHHAEFAPTFIGTQRTEVRPGVYAKVAWNF
jgi:iron complex outermembrane receptor protein